MREIRADIQNLDSKLPDKTISVTTVLAILGLLLALMALLLTVYFNIDGKMLNLMSDNAQLREDFAEFRGAMEVHIEWMKDILRSSKEEQ